MKLDGIAAPYLGIPHQTGRTGRMPWPLIGSGPGYPDMGWAEGLMLI